MSNTVYEKRIVSENYHDLLTLFHNLLKGQKDYINSRILLSEGKQSVTIVADMSASIKKDDGTEISFIQYMHETLDTIIFSDPNYHIKKFNSCVHYPLSSDCESDLKLCNMENVNENLSVLQKLYDEWKSEADQSMNKTVEWCVKIKEKHSYLSEVDINEVALHIDLENDTKEEFKAKVKTLNEFLLKSYSTIHCIDDFNEWERNVVGEEKIDELIYPLIQTFRKFGFETLASCSGHVHPDGTCDNNAYVMIKGKHDEDIQCSNLWESIYDVVNDRTIFRTKEPMKSDDCYLNYMYRVSCISDLDRTLQRQFAKKKENDELCK